MKKNHFIFVLFFICILLFSGCKKEEFTVTFHPNGGKGAIVTQIFTQKIAQPLMANSFHNRGYVFAGWNTLPDGKGVPYKDLETVIISENMVLYAQWATPTGEFTVTFHANGGEGEMEPQIFKAGVEQELSPNVYHNNEYHFTGWNTSANGTGKKFENQQIITLSSDLDLYAQWKKNYQTFFVTFYANGGEGKMELQAFKAGVYQPLDSNLFERTDYIFLGWNTDKEGKGYSHIDKETIAISSNRGLYAQWFKSLGSCPGTPTVNDIDGNTYNTVQIGSQCWLKENLKTTKYKTDENIPLITNAYDWEYSSTGAMCYYDNNVNNALKYGALYNGFAVNTGKLCPDGWKIPSKTEWDILAQGLGGNNIAGYYMKTTSGWNYNGNGNNLSNFSALPAGFRDYYFNSIEYGTGFWSETNSGSRNETVWLVYDELALKSYTDFLSRGLSVRCIKE